MALLLDLLLTVVGSEQKSTGLSGLMPSVLSISSIMVGDMLWSASTEVRSWVSGLLTVEDEAVEE